MNEQFQDGGRYCLHETLDDKLHAMLIHAKLNKKYPKHKHSDSNEFYIIIHGETVVEFWDELGKRSSINMSTNLVSDIRTLRVEKIDGIRQ